MGKKINGKSVIHLIMFNDMLIPYSLVQYENPYKSKSYKSKSKNKVDKSDDCKNVERKRDNER